MKPPRITTARLCLRAFDEGDIDPMHRILCGQDVLRYFPRSDPPPRERVERMIGRLAQHWDERGYGVWAVTARAGGELMGRCGLQYLPETDEVEIDFLLGRDFWGQGFATEAGRASLQYGRENLTVERIVGIVHPENRASRRVLEKLGFAFVERKSYFGMDCLRYMMDRAALESRFRSSANLYLIVVTGRPAAGKTTLARRLASDLCLPLVSKDSIREVLFDRLGWKDRAWAQLLGRASIDLMFHFAEAQLDAGSSLIMDNAFAPNLSTPRFQALQTRYGAGIIQIICDADSETLFDRFSERVRSGSRHPGHGDVAVLDELRTNLTKELSPVMDLGGPVITLDTTDFALIDHAGIAEQIRAILASEAIG